jgi:hypothetical protein
MKKSFRVATVFTGAAACAAAFAPTAAAAMPETPGATAHNLARAAISGKECGSATVGWFEMYYEPSKDHGPVCLGGEGIARLDTGPVLDGFCTGATRGSLKGYEFTSAGIKSFRSTWETPRTLTFFVPFSISYVNLTGHSGPPYTNCPA